ncbi:MULTISPECIES: cob(I)yrinic acid a,c-diamide adenosyltransferase [Bacillus]|uniref:cob(I)yrinic acid a,c-diamide adenosyltransferase n=1 Tax=Bacillus TaxID=1386 RepID=UPI0002D4030D|nr:MULTISPECIES: cob(I)yrinic acid a,c-diamide adenosyltransferase [Bacillus]
MKIYTKSGDKGTTSLVYGQRVSKTDVRVDAYGTCDEANSLIGLALSYIRNESFKDKEEVEKVYHKIQTELFHVGAELATPSGKKVHWKLEEEHIINMEKVIDAWDAQLPVLTNFVLPGGHPSGAAFHTARTVIRRAERCAVAIDHEVNPLVLSYLNRLSDLLFVTARFVNYQLNCSEPTLHDNE